MNHVLDGNQDPCGKVPFARDMVGHAQTCIDCRRSHAQYYSQHGSSSVASGFRHSSCLSVHFS